MTIRGRDSSAFLPNDAGLRQAYADGIRLWAGYFAGPGIWVGWPDSNFLRIKAAGMQSLAFCSGGSDPVACRARADRLGILFGSDTEANIPDGGQAWLDASGTGGAYGGAAVMSRRAAWHIVADYRAIPGDTWPSYLQRPTGPVGWQCQGTHSEYGGSVDSSRLDDWFGATPQGEDLTPEQSALLDFLAQRLGWAGTGQPPGANDLSQVHSVAFDPARGFEALKAELDAIKAQVAAIPAGPAGAKGDPGAAVIAPGTTITSTVQ